MKKINNNLFAGLEEKAISNSMQSQINGGVSTIDKDHDYTGFHPGQEDCTDGDKTMAGDPADFISTSAEFDTDTGK